MDNLMCLWSRDGFCSGNNLDPAEADSGEISQIISQQYLLNSSHIGKTSRMLVESSNGNSSHPSSAGGDALEASSYRSPPIYIYYPFTPIDTGQAATASTTPHGVHAPPQYIIEMLSATFMKPDRSAADADRPPPPSLDGMMLAPVVSSVSETGAWQQRMYKAIPLVEQQKMLSGRKTEDLNAIERCILRTDPDCVPKDAKRFVEISPGMAAIQQKANDRTDSEAESSSRAFKLEVTPADFNFAAINVTTATSNVGSELRTPKVNDDFTFNAQLIYSPDGGDQDLVLAVFAIDTQCKYDVISYEYLATLGQKFTSYALDQTPKTIGEQIDGTLVCSVGYITMRWRPYTESGQSPRKYHRTEFQVVHSDKFECIIGQDTANKHRMLLLNPYFFGHLKQSRPKQFTPTTSAAVRESAALRRAEAASRRNAADAAHAHTTRSSLATSANAQIATNDRQRS